MTNILIEIRESRQLDHPFEERKRQAKLRRARDMAADSPMPSDTDFKSRLKANGSDRSAILGEVDQLAVDIQSDDCPTEASERFMALFPMTLAPESWWEPVIDLPVTITRGRSRIDEIEDTLAFLLEPVVPEAAPADVHNFPENLSDKLSDWDTDEASLTTADLNVIPEELAAFAQADETAEDFRLRLKQLWQRFGIDDGEHFVGGGEPLSGEEKIAMREIDILLNSDEGQNAGLLKWLYPDGATD